MDRCKVEKVEMPRVFAEFTAEVRELTFGTDGWVLSDF
jgi:hypothetical protein